VRLRVRLSRARGNNRPNAVPEQTDNRTPDSEAARLVVRLVLATMVPAAAGFAVAAANEWWWAIVAVWALVVAVDIAIMVTVRRRTRANWTPSPHAARHATLGILLLAVSVGLILLIARA
jgi:hypothetical protein